MHADLPNSRSTTAPAHDRTSLDDQANQLMAAIDNALLNASSYRDPSPLPTTGTTPPVPQPGRPPMSERATDASALMLAGGVTTVMVGGTAATLMYVSQFADPVVCAIAFGAPAVLVLAVARLVSKAKAATEAAPATHHHHYSGPVVQNHSSINTQTRGLWASTRNQSAR